MSDKVNNIELLATTIEQANLFFQKQIQQQVNIAFTLRNWLIGYYIVEYEQNGEDRATYGKQLYKEITAKLKNKGVKSIRERHLYLCTDFYKVYPQILRTLSAKSYLTEFPSLAILPTPSAELSMHKDVNIENSKGLSPNDPELLLNRLSFSHFIELLKSDTSLKRIFYETQAIKNNWSTRELKRAMNTMLFERTGLSTDKVAVLEKQSGGSGLSPEDIFRDPYMLEFLGLEEKPAYSETDLEEAIINHLQRFLLEMGRGFCFEARQKRITFDNTHYRIDLVFYHRILKSSILIDLKIGEFSHADAGQMNVYLNYYRDNEMQKDDNPPVGIILCAGKNETLVKYATAGLPQKVFVSKYMINLPSEKELGKIIEEEQQKLQ